MDITPFIFAGLGTICSLLWLILFIKYHKSFSEYINAIEKGQYLLPELFVIGFGFIDMFHIDTNNKRASKQMKYFAELKGAKYSRFYYLVNLAGQITYLLTLVAVGLLLGAVVDISVAVMVILVGIVLVVYLDYDIQNKVEKRREEILISFPHVLSKMSLLINAGMPLREVIDKLAYSKEEILYQEIGIMKDEIHNGVSERIAMQNFADRCGVQEIRKFASLMIQNMEKGSREMADSLTEMAGMVWRDRKNNVRQMGEKASAKLMLPIMMIFIGIMLMVLVPMFSSVAI